MIYVCTHWFPQKRWAVLIGLGNSLGMLGSVFGQGPLRLAVNILDWRVVLLILAVIGLGLGTLIFLIIRNEPKSKSPNHTQKPKQIGLWKSLCIVMRNYRSWLVAIASGCYYSIFLGFGALWGVPFLREAYGFSEEFAGFATSMVYLGCVCGGPFIGYISDHLKNRKPVLLIFTFLTLIAMCPIIYIPNLPTWLVFFLIFITGLFGAGQLLTYVLAVELNPIEVKATSTGFTNMFAFIVGSALQPIMGKFLELWWNKKEVMGVAVYSVDNYVIALTWIPALTAFALLLFFFVREKNKLVTLDHTEITS